MVELVDGGSVISGGLVFKSISTSDSKEGLRKLVPSANQIFSNFNYYE